MPTIDAIQTRLADAGAVFLQFPTAEPTEEAPEPPTLEVAESVGALEAEYAAIRKGAALIDEPHAACVRVTGPERLEFLNNMLTQQLIERDGDGNGLAPWRSANSFWLNRKGRIDADLRVINTPDRTMLLTDVIAAPATATSLEQYRFAEDAEVVDETGTLHAISLHGPAAIKLVADHAEADADAEDAPAIAELSNNQNTSVRIAGHPVLVDRHDRTGDIGLTLLVHRDHAGDVYGALAAHARLDHGHNNPDDTNEYRLRLAGWGAFNIARLEAGTPLFRIDFSTNNLPAETGVLHDRVNFTKGCYLGQEVVARMDALGHPKQVLVPLRGEGADAGLPLEGAPVFVEGSADKPIGAVTSSTASPLLGGTPIALAPVKWGHHEAGTTLLTHSDAGDTAMTVHDSPAFIAR